MKNGAQCRSYPKKYAQGGSVRPADDTDAPDVTNTSQFVPGPLRPLYDRLPSGLGAAVTGNPFATDAEINETNRARVRAGKERDKQVSSRRDR